MTWKLVRDENPNFVCKKCGSDELKYRIVDDDYGHEDFNYWCPICSASWWVEGSDA